MLKHRQCWHLSELFISVGDRDNYKYLQINSSLLGLIKAVHLSSRSPLLFRNYFYRWEREFFILLSKKNFMIHIFIFYRTSRDLAVGEVISQGNVITIIFVLDSPEPLPLCLNIKMSYRMSN